MAKAKKDKRLYLRGGIWWARIKTENKTKRVSTGCKDYDASILRANELEKRAASPEYEASASVSLQEACSRFLQHLINGDKPDGTFKMYRIKVGHVLRVLGCETPLNRINPAKVFEFVETRLAEGAHARTVDKEIYSLVRTLKLAKHLGQYSGDIQDLKPFGFVAEYKPRERFLSDYPELQALIAQLPAMRAAQVCYMVATGCRWEESVTAERADINLETGLILVRGTKTKSSWRYVPILDIFRPALDLVLATVPEDSQGRMFPRWIDAVHGMPNACKRAGLAHATPHDLRRTAASWLRQAGVEPDLIGRFLGHTDGRQVERVYGRFPADRLAEAIGSRLGQSKRVPEPFPSPDEASEHCAQSVPAALGKNAEGYASTGVGAWRSMLKPLVLQAATALPVFLARRFFYENRKTAQKQGNPAPSVRRSARALGKSAPPRSENPDTVNTAQDADTADKSAKTVPGLYLAKPVKPRTKRRQ